GVGGGAAFVTEGSVGVGAGKGSGTGVGGDSVAVGLGEGWPGNGSGRYRTTAKKMTVNTLKAVLVPMCRFIRARSFGRRLKVWSTMGHRFYRPAIEAA
ncbi:hypothetical protein ACYOEI_42045, partial [Singulisphaera rosea]